jgi:hypothetical protein
MSDGGLNKYARWRAAVQQLLTSRWRPAAADVPGIAATVVGMFDAGAHDIEVALFLRDQELAQSGELWLTDDDRMALVEDLHEFGR